MHRLVNVLAGSNLYMAPILWLSFYVVYLLAPLVNMGPGIQWLFVEESVDKNKYQITN